MVATRTYNQSLFYLIILPSTIYTLTKFLDICQGIRTPEDADHDMAKFWTKIIQTQKFGQRSGTDQLLYRFTTYLFFDCNAHVITVHPPIYFAYSYSILKSYMCSKEFFKVNFMQLGTPSIINLLKNSKY